MYFPYFEKPFADNILRLEDSESWDMGSFHLERERNYVFERMFPWPWEE